MGKIVETKDRVFRITFFNGFYRLEEKEGRWFNKSWNELYKTTNKTIFIKKLNKFLV